MYVSVCVVCRICVADPLANSGAGRSRGRAASPSRARGGGRAAGCSRARGGGQSGAACHVVLLMIVIQRMRPVSRAMMTLIMVKVLF